MWTQRNIPAFANDKLARILTIMSYFRLFTSIIIVFVFIKCLVMVELIACYVEICIAEIERQIERKESETIEYEKETIQFR